MAVMSGFTDSPRRALGVAALLVIAVLVVSCSGGARPTPTPGTAYVLPLQLPASPAAAIGVSKNSVPVGSYATMDEAIAKASQIAGFQVQPVLNLPPGFTVSFFDALTAQPDPNAPYRPPQDAFYPRHVQIGVRSDSGGLLIDESSVRTTDEGDALKIATSSLGDFYEFGPSDAPLKYELVTTDRTFTILAPRANLTRAQALAILGGFH